MKQSQPLHLTYVVDTLPSWSAEEQDDALRMAREAAAYWNHQPVPVEFYIADSLTLGAVGIESKNYNDLYLYTDSLNLPQGTILLLHKTERMAFGGFARPSYAVVIYAGTMIKSMAHELGHMLGATDHSGGDVMDRYGLGTISWETLREILLAQGWREP